MNQLLLNRAFSFLPLSCAVHQSADARYFLLKFDIVGNADRDGPDPKGMTKVEYIYAKIARELGLDIPGTKSA